MPMHAPLQQHPNVAPHADSNGCHLLARKTRVLLAHCAACSEQWHAPPFIVWKWAEKHSKIASRKKHISCIVCIVIYCGYVYSISCLSIHHKPHIYHILIYVHIYNIYHIFLYHNIISYHITSNIHIILLSTKNTSYIYIYPTNSPVPVGPGDLPAQHGRSVPDPRCPRENHRQQPWLGCMTPG